MDTPQNQLDVMDLSYVREAFEATPVFRQMKEMAESDDYSRLEQSSAKRHHFVPRLLLKRFARSHNGRDCVFQSDKSTSKAPVCVPVGDAAVRNRLYDAVEEDGTRTRRIEGYFGMVESAGAPALEQLLADPTGLTPVDRASLAFFLAHQIMRTPAAAETINKLANAAFQTTASDWFSDLPSYAEAHRRFYGEDATDEEIEQTRQETLASIRAGNVVVADRGGAAFAQGIGHAAEQSFLIFDYDWTLLRCSGVFLTSDRAYAIHDPDPPRPWAAQGLLSSLAVEILIPLSEDTCLLLRPRVAAGTRPGNLSVSVQEIDPDDAEVVNLRVYGWAERFIYGSTQDAVVAVREAAKRRPRAIGKPREFSQVFLIEPDPGDDSLAIENTRAWGLAKIPHAGRLWDYVVIPIDQAHGDLRTRVDELVARRARKRLGVPDNAQVEGRITSELLHPYDLG